MTWTTYRPLIGRNPVPENGVMVGVRSCGEKLFVCLRIGKALAADLGFKAGDRLDVAKGVDSDAGLVRITKNGSIRIRKSTNSFEIHLNADFFGISKKYKDQACTSHRVGPKGELFAMLPAFVRKNGPAETAE